MADDRLTSVGIDIGTATLQCVFSQMTLKNQAPAFAVPRITLEDKRVLYRAPVRLTPLKTPDTIDGDKIAGLIKSDYEAAGISPGDIQCGAVIITGETARKINAKSVTQALAGLAGDFVVAVAGPRLESVLAGKGAGAAALSIQKGKPVLNIDIGGGTANLCLFVQGEPKETACLNVGGRLLRFNSDGTVHSYTHHLALIAKELGIAITVGAPLASNDMLRIAQRMASILEEAVNLKPKTALCEALLIGSGFSGDSQAELFTFSGGVADCIYGTADSSVNFFDLGQTLGQCIVASSFFAMGRVLRPSETRHATVIGAGAYSMTVTGSTIAIENVSFPMKGLPVANVPLKSTEDIQGLAKEIARQFTLFDPPFAIGFEGIKNPSYWQIEQIAQQIVDGMGNHSPKILVMAQDMAKALGQALMRRWGPDAQMICVDGISLKYGDTVDLGLPLAGGRTLPVVVKTLAFGF